MVTAIWVLVVLVVFIVLYRVVLWYVIKWDDAADEPKPTVAQQDSGNGGTTGITPGGVSYVVVEPPSDGSPIPKGDNMSGKHQKRRK